MEQAGLLDDLIRQIMALHVAVIDARLHARLGHPREVEQRAFDGLIAARRMDREINMNVLPKVEHIRGVLRRARKDAAEGRLMEAFLLLDGAHNFAAAPQG